MRRLTAIVLAIVLMGLALTASATGTDNYKDKFTSISWSGSDGSLHWSGPWSEIGDDGDEKKGNVRVVSSGTCASGNCMRMGALTTLLGSIGAVRTADTSDLEGASLSFDIRSTSSFLASTLDVQVNGGGGWVTVAQYNLAPGITEHPTIDVSGFNSENFQVRFLFSGLLLSSEVFIDNVEILGTIIEPTTTTTTTVPQTTTTSPTTTTTQAPSTTTTTGPETTTTVPGGGSGSTTSTTKPGNGSSTTTTIPRGPDGSTTSTTPGSDATTTTLPGSSGPGSGGGGPDGGDSDGGSDEGFGPGGSGIRAAARGLQANFQGDLYGEVRSLSSLNGIDFQADYSMAVEVIEASWAWMVLLGLVVSYSIISGLDKRR